MKNKHLLFLGIAFLFLGSTRINAQVGVNINIGLQPQWGPVEYNYVEYYYMPEYDLYYYAPRKQFVYLRGNDWVTVRNLPTQYRHVDLYNTYKVVINEPKPYLRHTYYVEHYKKFKGPHPKQLVIRDSHDVKYAKHNKPGAPSGKNMAERANQRKVQAQHSKGKGGPQHQGKGNKKH